MLDTALKVSLVVFMAGSLLEMGLGLGVREAATGLRHLRFVALALGFGFGIGPALALLLTALLPLSPSHETGLLLLGLTPCAPFLPLMVRLARGDMAHAAAMLLLAAVGTVIMLPLAAPAMVPGLSIDPWDVAGPLVAIVLLPLAAGMIIHRYAPRVARAVRPPIRRVTALATIVVLVLCGVIYGEDFLAVIGSFAIAAQVLYLGTLTGLSWVAAMGLPPDQRSVLGLGLSTRNVGAALAPLLTATTLDEGAIVMVVLGVPAQIAVSLLVARLHRSRTAVEAGGTP